MTNRSTRAFTRGALLLACSALAAPAMANDGPDAAGKSRSKLALISTDLFTPQSASVVQNFAFSRPTLTFGLAVTDGNGFACFHAPLDLPSGSKIDQIKVFYSSANEANLSFGLFAQNLESGEAAKIVNELIVDDSGLRKKRAIAVKPKLTVDDQKSIYRLTTCLASGQTLFGAQVRYTPAD